MTPIRTIAFVGLGNMGTPIAAQLAAKDFALSLYDRREEATRVFAAVHGGRAATVLRMPRAMPTPSSPRCPTMRPFATSYWARGAWPRRWRPAQR